MLTSTCSTLKPCGAPTKRRTTTWRIVYMLITIRTIAESHTFTHTQTKYAAGGIIIRWRCPTLIHVRKVCIVMTAMAGKSSYITLRITKLLSASQSTAMTFIVPNGTPKRTIALKTCPKWLWCQRQERLVFRLDFTCHTWISRSSVWKMQAI